MSLIKFELLFSSLLQWFCLIYQKPFFREAPFSPSVLAFQFAMALELLAARV